MTQPSEENYFYAQNFSSLDDIKNQVVNEKTYCMPTNETTIPSTPTPTTVQTSIEAQTQTVQIFSIPEAGK